MNTNDIKDLESLIEALKSIDTTKGYSVIVSVMENKENHSMCTLTNNMDEVMFNIHGMMNFIENNDLMRRGFIIHNLYKMSGGDNDKANQIIEDATKNINLQN